MSKYPKTIMTIYLYMDRPKPYDRYIHVGVRRFYKDKKGILFIEDARTKQIYTYDLKHVKEIRMKVLDPKKVV